MEFLRFFKGLAIFLSLVVLSFLSPPTVSAEGTPTLTFVSRILSDAKDVEVDGGYAYTSHLGGIAFVSVSDPTQPVVVGEFPANGCNYFYLDISGNTLFSSQMEVNYGCSRDSETMHNSLHIIDVANKVAPTELGYINIDGPGASTETYQWGIYNYFTNDSGGLVIIDTTDLANPEIVDVFTQVDARFYDVNVVGQTAYLADVEGKLWIVDVTDPSDVHVLSDVDFPGADVLRVDVIGSYAYVAAGGMGLQIVDITNPADPEVVGGIDWTDEIPTDNNTIDVDIEGSYAFVSNSYRGVVVVDISDPTNPVEVIRLSLDGYAKKIEVSGGYVYVADVYKGLNILKFEVVDEEGVQLDVPLFKQTDPSWRDLTYDAAEVNSLFCGTTIGGCGCALSSIAMVLKYYGVDKDLAGNSTTPESVNNYFIKNKSCDEVGCSSLGYSYGSVLWSAAGKYSADSHKVFGSQKIVFKGATDFDMETAKSKIESEEPVIIRVPGKQHWAVAKGTVENTLTINDPFFDRIRLDDPAYANSALAARFYEKTASDFSSFEVTSKAPTQLLVKDNQGRRTGFDPATNTIVREIPNSFYDFEGSYADPGDSGIYSVIILTSEQNNYDVKVIGAAGSKYGFTVHASDKDAETDLNIFSGTLPNSGSLDYTFGYTPDTTEDAKFSQEISINIWPFIKKNIIIRRLKLPIGVGILSNPTFNAPKDLNKKSLTFGRTGDEKSLINCAKLGADLNGDKLKDVYCLFSSQKAGFKLGDTKGILKGQTTKNLDIFGSDSVIIY